MAQNVAKFGSTEYATLQEVVNSVAQGGKGYIYILADATFDKLSIDGKQIIINLQTHTVNGNDIAVNGVDKIETYLKILDAKAKGLSVDKTNNYKVSYTTSGTLELTGNISAYNGACIKVESGTVVSTKDVALFAIGDITGQKDIASSVEITGGYVKAQECCASPQGRGATVTVNGSAVLESLDNAVVAGNGTKGQGGTTINISGGTLTANPYDATSAACGIYHPNEGTLTITGGIYSSDVSKYCVEGFTSIPNADGTYGISAVGDMMIVYDKSYADACFLFLLLFLHRWLLKPNYLSTTIITVLTTHTDRHEHA